MRRVLSTLLLIPCLAAACCILGEDTPDEDEDLALGPGPGGGPRVAPPGPDDVPEALYFDNKLCHMVFRNVSSPAAEVFFIWNLGVDGVRQESPYPTNARRNLYAVFAPSPANAVHHVDGQDQFDHYHIVDASPDARHSGYDGTWDVFLVFPGPNFNAATYQVAKTVDAMNRQIRDGILGPITKTTDAGFDPLVLHAEIFDRCH
jgi:hypothetical protein